MNKSMLFVDAFTDHLTPANQLRGCIILYSRKILLRIYNRIKITSIGHIKSKLAKLRAFHFKIGCSKVSRDIAEFYSGYFFSFLLILNQDKSCRSFHPHYSRNFRVN
ncbi:hypothetical protein D3C71_1580250 [compost metagenome]